MLLERLVLCDVGTYRGEQSFELAPKERAGKMRPVVLFGGLNGAGKTTLLDSIRLVLYGRQSLDVVPTQKEYEQHLRALIHDGAQQLVKPDRAHIELSFHYARLGKRLRYTVCRSWVDQGNTVQELLRVTQEGMAGPLLEGDSAQAFLTQLIPAGVSQFFFFDGEKIAALAKDDSDDVLADAIKRLLGLDVADRLRSDLAVYQRGRRTEGDATGIAAELKKVYEQIDTVKLAIEADEVVLSSELMPALTAAKQVQDQRRGLLADQGGAWAVNRKALEQELDELSNRRRALEDQAREALAGVAVFALAPKLSALMLKDVQSAQRAADQAQALNAVSQEATALKARLSKVLAAEQAKEAVAACVDEWLRELQSQASAADAGLPGHSINSADAEVLRDALQRQLPKASEMMQAVGSQLATIATRGTQVQDQLAHAPSEASIEEAFAGYQAATAKVAELEVSQRVQAENTRLRIGQLLDLMRRARKLEEQADAAGTDTRADKLATQVQSFIVEFKQAAAVAKCKALEVHFLKAFKRLARKEDIVDSVRIDPQSFSVVLVDKQGRETPKKRLSAGEKQIYAIAMLEALAKASGRSLPIIIDTPLGRLDSKHRTKLIESYIPSASHQVMVLSTDTEVDENFYRGLRPSISHAYHLTFNESERYTTVSKGYFWKQQELPNAA
jgi:DNA sulfur modification protein DndD